MPQPPATSRRTRSLRRYVLVVVALATLPVLLGACLTTQPSGSTSQSSGSRSDSATQSPFSIQTVFVIVLENHSWSQIAGNRAASYINSLLPQGAHAEQYYTPPGVHPSAPDYLWMVAGTDFGLSGLTEHTPQQYAQQTTDHLADYLEKAGVSWKAYFEDIDGLSCPLTDVNQYAVDHNPFVFFTDVTSGNDPNAARCIAHVRPYVELQTDLGQDTVARYNFIVPNLSHDMHSGSLADSDTWLANNLPVILTSRTYLDGGAVFLLWDEGSSPTRDGPLGMIVMSPAAKVGYSNSIHYTHSSLLRTVQEILGVQPLLGDAANATDLSDLFTSFPAAASSTAVTAGKRERRAATGEEQ